MPNVRLTKKPVTINGMPVGDIIHLAHYNWKGLPEWVIRGYNDGRLVITNDTVTVVTLDEGNSTVDFRWWILEGTKGELYPCREDVVWECYDKAEEQ